MIDFMWWALMFGLAGLVVFVVTAVLTFGLWVLGMFIAFLFQSARDQLNPEKDSMDISSFENEGTNGSY